MTNHATHEEHDHRHQPGCDHLALRHDGHVDYLHDGHLHHQHEDHYDEHVLAIDSTNPAGCSGGHQCDGHDAEHRHGADCGHDAVPHGDHQDYLVGDHLHHPHDGHCDSHGPVELVAS